MAQNIDVNINVKLTNEQRIAQLEKELDSLQKTGNKGIVSFNQLASALSAVVSVKIISDIANTNLQFQQLAQKINIAAGSAEAGAKALGQIRSFAKDSQLSVGELGNTFIRLKSAGIEPSTEILELFNKATEASTDKTGTLESMTTLFSKAARGAGIDMKSLNQLALDGIPVFEILQAKLGMNAQQLEEFTKDGQNTLPVLQALRQGIQELNVTPIANDLEKSFKNFKQATEEASLAIGEAGLNAAIVNLLDTISKLLADNELLIQSIGSALGTAINIATTALAFFIENIELFVSLGAAIIFYQAAAAISAMRIGLIAATAAQVAFNAAARANPYILAGSAILALASYFGITAAKAEDAKNKTEELNTTLGGVSGTAQIYGGIFDKNTHSLGLFSKAQRDATTSMKEFEASQKEKDENAATAMLDKLREANKSYLDGLIRNSMDTNERIFYEQELHVEKLRMLLEKKVINEQEYAKYTEAVYKESNQRLIEEEYRKNKELDDARKKNLDLWKQGKYEEADITNLTEQQKLEILGSTAKQALEVAATQNKKAFMLNKAVSIGQAIMNTYEGASKALAQGGVFGPFLAAAVIASGLAQVAAIRAQNYPGREKGGTVVAGKPYMVGEAGPELFQPGQTGRIVPNDQLQSTNGDIVNINFNVSTVDAKGFDELLSSRRELIVNTVNEAMRERGMRGLTA